MFATFRAGGFAAAAALLSATIVAADSTRASGVEGEPVASFATHLGADSEPLALADGQESPQVVLPVQRATLPASDHSDITVDGLADPGETVVPIQPVLAEKALPATLAELVAEHRSSQIPDRERECLAGAIYFESKGEPLSGQVAVGQVIVNRAKSGRFPKSWCGVVFQRSQFSFVRGGGLPPIPRGSAHWKTAVAVAHIVANDLTDAVVPKALFFHARYVSPNWKRVSRVATVGNHIFYR